MTLLTLTDCKFTFSLYGYVILVGGFNVNLLSSSYCSTKRILECIQCMNLQQYVTQATPFTKHLEILIDLTCFSVKVTNACFDYITNHGSNHNFLSCKLHVKKSK